MNSLLLDQIGRWMQRVAWLLIVLVALSGLVYVYRTATSVLIAIDYGLGGTLIEVFLLGFLLQFLVIVAVFYLSLLLLRTARSAQQAAKSPNDSAIQAYFRLQWIYWRWMGLLLISMVVVAVLYGFFVYQSLL